MTDTIKTTTKTTASTISSIKEIEPVKHTRNFQPKAPNISEVNAIIDNYNSIIGETRSFRPLSSLFER